MFFHHKIKRISPLPFDVRSSMNTHHPSLQAAGILFLFCAHFHLSDLCTLPFNFHLYNKYEDRKWNTVPSSFVNFTQVRVIWEEKNSIEKNAPTRWTCGAFSWQMIDWCGRGQLRPIPVERILNANMDRLRYVGSWLMGRIQTFCNGRNWAVQRDWPIRMRIQMRGSKIYTAPSSS